MQFSVLQFLRNALASHFLKHLVACFVCMFLSMRKDLGHPYLCSPLPEISYAFLYPLLATNIFICILEMNLPVIGTWYAWWKIVLRKMAHLHACSQSLKSREESRHIDPQPWRWGGAKAKGFASHLPPWHAQGTWLHPEGNICKATEITPRKEAFLQGESALLGCLQEIYEALMCF